MTDATKENLIRGLYQEFNKTKLPDKENEKYLFDESTGTYYCLTGKSRMERPEIESAERYFRKVLSGLSGSGEYEKKVYIAIAIEAINKMLESNGTEKIAEKAV